MEDFLSSKAMLTPGVAGATTTTIAGTLATQFGIPGTYTSIIVSFLLGLVVFSDKLVPLFQRVVLYLANSMIIYTVAIGLNTAGAAAMKSDEDIMTRSVPSAESTGSIPFFHPWF